MCGQQLVNAAGEHLHVDLCANTVISSDKYIFPARFPSLKTNPSKMNSSFLLFLSFSFFFLFCAATVLPAAETPEILCEHNPAPKVQP